MSGDGFSEGEKSQVFLFQQVPYAFRTPLGTGDLKISAALHRLFEILDKGFAWGAIVQVSGHSLAGKVIDPAINILGEISEHRATVRNFP